MACERGPTCSLTVTSHAVIELPHPVCRSDAGGPTMPRPSWADSLREEDRQINDKPTYTYEPTSGQGEVETKQRWAWGRVPQWEQPVWRPSQCEWMWHKSVSQSCLQVSLLNAQKPLAKAEAKARWKTSGVPPCPRDVDL